MDRRTIRRWDRRSTVQGRPGEKCEAICEKNKQNKIKLNLKGKGLVARVKW
jgi:hypothetical protein